MEADLDRQVVEDDRDELARVLGAEVLAARGVGDLGQRLLVDLRDPAQARNRRPTGWKAAAAAPVVAADLVEEHTMAAGSVVPKPIVKTRRRRAAACSAAAVTGSTPVVLEPSGEHHDRVRVRTRPARLAHPGRRRSR